VTSFDRPAAKWTMVAGWMAVNITLSHQPRAPVPHIPGFDKALHLVEYAILAFLLARAVFPAVRGRSPATRWTLMVLACFLYGIVDETHQAFVPGRSCDPVDAVADAAGGLVVAIACLALRRRPWIRRLGVD